MSRGRKPAAKKRDADALERRRLEGARLLNEGLNHSQVAHKLGVSRQAVVKWKRRLKKGSSLTKKRPGPKSFKPTKKQLAILRKEIKKRPEDCFTEECFIRLGHDCFGPYRDGDFRKYKDGRWTVPLFARLIDDKFPSLKDRRTLWIGLPTVKRILKLLRSGM